MARYTGPNNKQARRVSFSILENGKDIAKRDLMVQDNMVKTKKNLLTMLFN